MPPSDKEDDWKPEDDYSETFIRDSEEIAEEMGGWEGVYTGSLGSA